MRFYSPELKEYREIENPESCVVQGRDGIDRNSDGVIIAVTPHENNPKYKNFIVKWLNVSIPPYGLENHGKEYSC